MTDEIKIENEIQAKGLNAPRLKPKHIDAKIKSVAYHVFPGTTLTVCAMTLTNGFVVTGESAAASPENFDRALGEKIAHDNARAKIWAFEGYVLREKLSIVEGHEIEAELDMFPGLRPVFAKIRDEIAAQYE